MGEASGDARRLLLSRLVVDHKMRPRDPMSLDDADFETAAAKLLLDEGVPTPEQARRAVAG
jgi:hypothetical protein